MIEIDIQLNLSLTQQRNVKTRTLSNQPLNHGYWTYVWVMLDERRRTLCIISVWIWCFKMSYHVLWTGILSSCYLTLRSYPPQWKREYFTLVWYIKRKITKSLFSLHHLNFMKLSNHFKILSCVCCVVLTGIQCWCLLSLFVYFEKTTIRIKSIFLIQICQNDISLIW